ncbi:hypothetical protein KCP73_03450 [Salmonella enterica subsp. enterica]|nr:hypothetical protein KCP73_03450 [Salmonella enterica subsp. enterica]
MNTEAGWFYGFAIYPLRWVWWSGFRYFRITGTGNARTHPYAHWHPDRTGDRALWALFAGKTPSLSPGGTFSHCC